MPNTERAVRGKRNKKNPTPSTSKIADAPYHADALGRGRRLQLEMAVAAAVFGARNGDRLLDRKEDGGGEKQRRLCELRRERRETGWTEMEMRRKEMIR